MRRIATCITISAAVAMGWAKEEAIIFKVRYLRSCSANTHSCELGPTGSESPHLRTGAVQDDVSGNLILDPGQVGKIELRGDLVRAYWGLLTYIA